MTVHAKIGNNMSLTRSLALLSLALLALPASADEFQPRFLDQESQVRAPPPLPRGVG